MRLPRRSEKEKPEASPEDTQEMFAAGQARPGQPEETREYETVVLQEQEPLEDETVVLEEQESLEDEATAEDETAETESFEEDDLEAIEDESWEGDEYEEWEDEPDDSGLDDPEIATLEEGEEPTTEADQGSSRGEDLKEWSAAFGQQVRTIWSGIWTRVGAIKLPRHEIDGQKVLAVAGVLVIALLVGGAGYLLGKGSGDDLDQARLEGEFAGRRAGAVAGATKGYAAGFKRGRDLAFRKSYSASYRRNYIRAYDNAGMDPPKPEDIEVPKP